MSLAPDITPEQIDDWFKIGKKAIKREGIPKSSTKGRLYDPVTRKPREQPSHYVPHYKRFVLNCPISTDCILEQ